MTDERLREIEAWVAGADPDDFESVRVLHELLAEVRRQRSLLATHDAFFESIHALEPHLDHARNPTAEALLDYVKRAAALRAEVDRLREELASAVLARETWNHETAAAVLALVEKVAARVFARAEPPPGPGCPNPPVGPQGEAP